MIFDYYCIDCGNQFQGEKICFDLAELAGVRTNHADALEDVLDVNSTKISFEEVCKFSSDCGCRIDKANGKRSIAKVNLAQFLQTIAYNQKKSEDIATRIDSGNISQLEDLLMEFYTGNASDAEKEQDIKKFCDSIKTRFVKNQGETEENESIEFSNFVATYVVEPKMFEESDSIYSLEYHYDIQSVNMRKIGKSGTIRGYCPVCGKTILEGAGKYRHTLVGLIGIQKAGKTSTIVAMLEEIRQKYRELGIRFPGNPLWGSRSNNLNDNIALYRNGYAVVKTNAATAEAAFNASLLVEADCGDTNVEVTAPNKKQIITFVDIAGDLCYDETTNELNQEAFQTYPLINRCHMYLLCTGIAPDDDDIESTRYIPPEAALMVGRGIYENLHEKKNIPPICIVATKADLAGNAVAGAGGTYNPFDRIQPSSMEYLYVRELNNFKDLYSSATSYAVREALDICYSAFEELSSKTYVSMMSCWALGRKAVKCEDDNKTIRNLTPYLDENNKPLPFNRMRIDRLLTWIFQVCGIVDVEGYGLPYIPSKGEGYITGYDDIDVNNRLGSRRAIFEIDEAADRIESIQKLFLNVDDEEDNIKAELRHFREHRPLFGAERKWRKLLDEIL